MLRRPIRRLAAALTVATVVSSVTIGVATVPAGADSGSSAGWAATSAETTEEVDGSTPTAASADEVRRLSATESTKPFGVGGPSPSARPTTAGEPLSDRAQNTPTSWWWYTDVDEEGIRDLVAKYDARVVEIDVVDEGSPSRFAVRLVRNSGAYAAKWAWHTDKTLAEVNQLVAAFDGRIVDLTGYHTADGIRYAFTMVEGTGGPRWIWRSMSDPDAIVDTLEQGGYRPVDIGEFRVGSTTYYTVVAVENTDDVPWQWLRDRTASEIASGLESGQRVVDVDADPGTASPTRYGALIYQDSRGFWRWDTGFTSPSQVVEYARQTGTRPISIDEYTVDGSTRYSGVFLENLSGVASTMRNRYWRVAAKNGSWGFELQQVGGPVKATLQGTKPYEAASSLKVLYHLHGLRERQLGRIQDDTALTYRYSKTPDLPDNDNLEHNICPDRVSNTASRPYSQIDQYMMTWSDNRFTRAITDRYGRENILASTGEAAGLTDTVLGHNIGCPTPETFNLTTARDVNGIYAAVYRDHDLLDATHRELFHDRMLNESNSSFRWGPDDIDRTDGFCPVVRQEAAALGKSSATADEFCAAVVHVYKPGAYHWWNGDPYPRTISHSDGSLTGLPLKTSDGTKYQYFVYASFIHLATIQDADQEAKVTSARKQAFYDGMRPEIRAALRTW
ncbi:MAG TPA: serine hydrolase [Actinopolymorphaceae bacterium]